MSRSTYIWVVVGAVGVPVAAFTVKHELKSWWACHPQERAGCCITRIRDIYTSFEVVALDPMTLEPLRDQPKEGDRA